MESTEGFGYYEHFYNINSSDPWAWDIFPFICVFFFHQSHIVFSVQIFNLLG